MSRPSKIDCPFCPNPKPRLFVVQTERPASGIIVRWRRCRECGRRFKSVERLVSTRRSKVEGTS